MKSKDVTSPTPSVEAIISDARIGFDYYLDATKHPLFQRVAWQSQTGSFLYPEPTCQVDAAAFAGTFNCLWRALEAKKTFDASYAEKKAAFDEIVRIITPNKPDPKGFTSHARFWRMDRQVPIGDGESARLVCRTLRNGFAHFNFRYINVSPRRYFAQIALALPAHIPEPDIANNYRIFICDWNQHKRRFMDPHSDTRIIETHFGHMRYHLFMFLARFFTKPDDAPYQDILTGKPIS